MGGVVRCDMLDTATREWLTALARQTVDAAVRRGDASREEPEEPEGIGAGARQVMGGFVTLTLDGELRGCIGEIFPTREIWRVVREQAVNAALHDPRFQPLTIQEAPRVRIEISALTAPEPVESWREIVLGRHGIVLKKGTRSAVFLPQVPGEQGWDLETTLRFLSRKAGLAPDAWEHAAHFLVFEAEVFGEA
jgi:AmmeMemoRadiSam system protein A